MNRATMILLVLVTLLLVAAAAFFLVPRGHPLTRGVSPMGRIVLKEGGAAWEHGISDHYVAHAVSAEEVNEVLRKAEYAYSRVTDTFGMDAAKRRAHIFVVSDSNAWDRLRSRRGWRNDGQALQFVNEFVVLAVDTNAMLRDDVPHEIVHYRLQETYGEKLPLALEEGMAAYLGWEITLGYHLLHGRILTRSQKSPDAEKLFLIKDLLALERYPEDPEAMRAMFFQSETFVRGAADMVGRERLGEFISRYVETGRSWDAILVDDFGVPERDISDFQRAVELHKYEGK